MSTRKARPSTNADVQALHALLASVVARSRPNDDRPEVALARGILARTCASCGDDLDEAGRRDPQRLCPACRPAVPVA